MKFKLCEKVKYMVFGSLLTLAGFMFGSLNNGIDAQSESEVINELKVQKLVVYDNIILYDTNQAMPEPRVVIMHDVNGGDVSVYGKARKPLARIGIASAGGNFWAYGKNEIGAVNIGVGPIGGRLQIANTQQGARVHINAIDDKSADIRFVSADGEQAAMLGMYNNIGVIKVGPITGKGSVIASVDRGDGFVITTDKFGTARKMVVE